MFSALLKSAREERSGASLRANVLAGLTVGVIALPLSMALAIATGVPPQHGLYTAIIAGIVIALAGGSQVNISGPTAAFVVVLLPIVQTHGLGGLLIAGLMAGIILILLGLARMGAFIGVVPYPVTIGFTAGIGVVIATLQIKDLFGLDIATLGGHFTDKVIVIVSSLGSLRWQETGIALLTLGTLIVWQRRRSRLPSHLVALLVGSLTAWAASAMLPDFSVATIGTRFHYELGGTQGSGIPPLPPQFVWPWNQPGADGAPVGVSFDLIRSLIGPAFAIAVLGAIESLLCAVVADGMSGKRHNSNDELIGQGLGNVLAPFFGGIPATAAIARTAANVRMGGTSPLSSVVHALFILAAILSLAPLLAYIPMASMAALLMMVAWNMAEARHFLRITRVAPREDIITLLTCFSLTVLFDMVIAVAVGMGLAAMLFIRRSIALTGVNIIERREHDHAHLGEIPDHVVVYDINGPLFFGSTEKALSNLAAVSSKIRTVILDMKDVTMLDMTAIVALESIVADLSKRQIVIVICSLEARMKAKLARVGLEEKEGVMVYCTDVERAVENARAISQ
jgi:SulP family sulfate permease